MKHRYLIDKLFQFLLNVKLISKILKIDFIFQAIRKSDISLRHLDI